MVRRGYPISRPGYDTCLVRICSHIYILPIQEKLLARVEPR
ncbi:hypothetical protein SLEP1_g12321 [Rubroshorea leprosula]|uniref:Uncharacterized protein n=1 Tax=Rubroshorea leprosula TaxID=152421 RepID=A0AAV5ILB8_9ROSI|nr:hypothetical protein SLEP1_g12321 [Rubroshorea leprosula]